jgi:hypothetical protein
MLGLLRALIQSPDETQRAAEVVTHSKLDHYFSFFFAETRKFGLHPGGP